MMRLKYYCIILLLTIINFNCQLNTTEELDESWDLVFYKDYFLDKYNEIDIEYLNTNFIRLSIQVPFGADNYILGVKELNEDEYLFYKKTITVSSDTLYKSLALISSNYLNEINNFITIAKDNNFFNSELIDLPIGDNISWALEINFDSNYNLIMRNLNIESNDYVFYKELIKFIPFTVSFPTD